SGIADAGGEIVEDRPAGAGDTGRGQIECRQIRRRQFSKPNLASFDEAERRRALTRLRPPASGTLSRPAGEGLSGAAFLSLSCTAGEGGRRESDGRVGVFPGCEDAPGPQQVGDL